MPAQPKYEFERKHPIHETRDAKGFLNRLRPPSWLEHVDRKTQLKTVGVLRSLLSTESPYRQTVLSIGVGGGGLYRWMWTEPDITRLGMDVNHEVMLKALVDDGPDHYMPIEGDAAHVPLGDASVDVVVFDFVLHHLVGQSALESAIEEGMRVLRPGGYMVSREPSSYSPSGVALNVVNRFGMMNRLSGASNSEFALAPPRLIKLFSAHGTVLAAVGLTYLWSHRMPIWMQDALTRAEPHVFRGTHAQWFADFVLYVVRKGA